ncbi:MAG: hypothetical protein CMP76_01500 [Flavobacterium sp.]|uniref:hypothetical protein n=1 Tax=unclassified Flavobacterium TaxID=196869 RepID=UPI000C3E793F|nr:MULTISPECIES: hypothetical protein [unclassified Flavobacterium]MBF01948.1 hypothetical protein [Flavobacterium sp.]MCO6164316.1 hypothetical protein [Flavobacterium sp. NRK F7]|tara:strand:- start:2032 stop:2313 length:282 start_codon:yes stop_codon:yes gene_type:complete
MENQKDLEALRHSLSLKLEAFNKIRFGYADESFKNQQIKREEIVFNTIEAEEGELVGVESDFDSLSQSFRKPEYKSAMNLTNLGTSYFGRRRR